MRFKISASLKLLVQVRLLTFIMQNHFKSFVKDLAIEFKWRLLFILFSFSLTIIVCYYFLNELFFLAVCPLIEINLFYGNETHLTVLNFTEYFNLFVSFFAFIILVSLFFNSLINLFFILSSALYQLEKTFLKLLLVLSLFMTLVGFFLTLFILVPNV